MVPVPSPVQSARPRTDQRDRLGCLSSQRRCWYERGRQRGSDLGRLYFDDLRPHGRQGVQELVLFGFPDLEVVQNRDDIFHEGIPLATRHPPYCDAPPSCCARCRCTAHRSPDRLCRRILVHPVYVGPGELLADAVVLHFAIYDRADDCRDGIDSAESVIQECSTVFTPLLSCEDLGLARKGPASEPVIQHHRGPSRPHRPNGWFFTVRSASSDWQHGGCVTDVRSTKVRPGGAGSHEQWEAEIAVCHGNAIAVTES
jgi:hypothetical protein